MMNVKFAHCLFDFVLAIVLYAASGDCPVPPSALQQARQFEYQCDRSEAVNQRHPSIAYGRPQAP